MPAYNVKTEFEMTDGRVLSCEYMFYVTPGNYSGPMESSYPDECEIGEPTYCIDGEEVSYNDLPKGLSKIADELYEADSASQFGYTEVPHEEDFELLDFNDDY